jgi:hypothetical protein
MPYWTTHAPTISAMHPLSPYTVPPPLAALYSRSALDPSRARLGQSTAWRPSPTP